VVAYGYVGVYAERGVYQLYVNRIQAAGRGLLYAQFEALKARLEAEGLFDMLRKRPLPAQPRRIGVITSASGAALRDILRVLSARWPVVEVVLFPTLVQGMDAPAQIAAAVEMANWYAEVAEALDTLIVARGGGSIEDLWAFNDERVAYAIARSEVPVISGVGHEIDFTIADFVADLRAPTPSAAAAAAVPDRREMQSVLAGMLDRMAGWMEVEITQQQRELEQAQQRLARLHPQRKLDTRRQQLDDRERRLHAAVQRRIHRLAERTSGARLRLNALNPQAVLRRGYSIVQKSDGALVRGPADIALGETMLVQAAGGAYRAVRSE
jgi:exodeoxyribonuclease VII large subunit